MKAAILFAALVAGCGRFGFDATGDDAGLTGADSGSAAAPLILPIGSNTLDAINDIAFDASGGFAIVGNFSSTLTIGSSSVTTAASQGFDMYAAGFDAGGAPRWLWSGAASVAGSGQNLAFLPDGRLFLVGYFGGTLGGAGNIDSGSGQDALQLWLTATGGFDDVKHSGGSQNVQTRGMAATSGKFAFGGAYADTVDFGTGLLPGTNGLDNGFIAVGDVASGVTSSRAFNGMGDVFVNDVAIDSSGRLCVGGRFVVTSDFGGGAVSPGPASSGFVARYDAGLSFSWVRELDNANVQSVGIAANGDCFAGGFSNGPFTIDALAMGNAGGNDGFAVRFASVDGHAQWLQSIAGAGQDTVYSLVPIDLDRVAIAGFFAGTAMVAGMPEVSEGDSDGFVIGLDHDGNLVWTQLLAGSGAIPDTLAGMDVDLADRKLGLAAAFNGELRVGTATQTVTQDSGLALVLPLPP